MKHARSSFFAVAVGAALFALATVPSLRADELTNNRTIMTFSAPVDISGHVLPAGSYVFKTLPDDRDVVVVMNREESHLAGIFNTIGITNPAVSDKTQVEMSEGAANSPEVVHAWFYPGDSLGWDFPAGPTAR